MTAPAPEVETDLINDLTDKAIAKDINKYERMVEDRLDKIDDLYEEAVELNRKKDALLDEQIKRLSAKKQKVQKPVESPDGEV